MLATFLLLLPLLRVLSIYPGSEPSTSYLSSTISSNSRPRCLNASLYLSGKRRSDGPVSKRKVPTSVSVLSLCMRPPTCSFFSQRMTSYPARAKRPAMLRPPTPAPTTTALPRLVSGFASLETSEAIAAFACHLRGVPADRESFDRESLDFESPTAKLLYGCGTQV